MSLNDQSLLEEQLNSFNSPDRLYALETLAQRIRAGRITTPPIAKRINLRFRSSFSQESNSWSPSRVAWESLMHGLEVTGIADFGTLDGMDEFLAAGDILGIRSVVGLQATVVVPSLADKVIGIPNEPGKVRFLAFGCVRMPDGAGEISRKMLQPAASGLDIDEASKLAMEVLGALPAVEWMDGMSEGESDARRYLQTMQTHGICAISVLPERNWNFIDPDEKNPKLRKLQELIEATRYFDIPIFIGREISGVGQPIADDLLVRELENYKEDFLHGARVVHGHTILSRYADFGYFSKAAEAYFDTQSKKNLFFSEVGMCLPPVKQRKRLADLRGRSDPKEILNILGLG